MSTMRSIAALMLLLAACGTTNRDAIDGMRGDFAAERARLAGWVAQLPPSSTITSSTIAPFSPPLVWSDASATRGQSTAAFVSLGQLANPDVIATDRGPDVTLDSELVTCLRWTGPQSPMAATALDTRDGERLTAECRAALAVPYVVVLRPVTYQAPVATSPEAYVGGSLTTDVIVLAHATGTVIATARVEGHSAEAVTYTYQQGSDPAEALTRFAYSTLWSSLRAAIAAAFAAGGHRVTVSV